MYKKEVTHDDSLKFWDDFMVRHPEIYNPLVGNRLFIDETIGAFQPATMDNDSYEIFNRYLKRWLSDNDFTDPELDLIVVSLNEDKNKGVRAIDTASIIELEPTNDNLTKLTFKEDITENIISIYVKEDYEKLKRSVYIF